MYKYLANNTTNISKDVYKKTITTSCFGVYRPKPGFLSERVLVFIRFMRLCNDGEISSYVVLIITIINFYPTNAPDPFKSATYERIKCVCCGHLNAPHSHVQA